MGDRELIFDVTEFSTISVRCPRCQNPVIFQGTTDPKLGVPHTCPTCESPLHTHELFATFRHFCQTVQAFRSPIEFRVREKADRP